MQWSCDVKLLRCVWLCDPMDCSLPGSSVHGIFQVRILEWVAISWYKGAVKTLCHPPSISQRNATLNVRSPQTMTHHMECCFEKTFKDVHGQMPMKWSKWGWHLRWFSSAQSCLILCDPMDCNTPGLLVHHQLQEFTQTHVHWVGDAIQPSHPLSSPVPPTFNLS